MIPVCNVPKEPENIWDIFLTKAAFKQFLNVKFQSELILHLAATTPPERLLQVSALFPYYTKKSQEYHWCGLTFKQN